MIRLLLALLLVFLQGTASTGPTKTAGPTISTHGASGGGPSFVQACQAENNTGTASNLNCVFSSGTASGNGVSIYVFWATTAANAPATGDISDPSSDTFTFVTSKFDSTNSAAGAMHLATTVTAGTTTLTFNCLARTATLHCNGFQGFVAFEVHGGSRVSDGSNSVNAAGSTTANADVCTSITTGTSGDLIVFGATDTVSNTTTFSAGTSPLSFTVPTNGSTTNKLATMEYGTQSSAGSINPAFTGSTTNTYVGVCMGIK